MDHTLSIVDYVKRINQEAHDGDPRFFSVPETRAQVATALLLLDGSGDTAPFLYPHWEDAAEARVSIRINTARSADLAALIDRCNRYLESHIVTDPSLIITRTSLYPGSIGVKLLDTLSYDARRVAHWFGGREVRWPQLPERVDSGHTAARVTGVTVLYAGMADRLVESQVSSITLAFVVIWIVVVVILRSPWAGTVAMIPNLFPIMVILGIMGFAGVTLNIGTAMVSSICVGIAVDDTIHFMTRYRLHLGEATSQREAMRAALREVGRPIVYTSLALALGFSIFYVAAFRPHVEFGILSAVTMLAALVGDLVLLPACLLILKPRIPPSRGAPTRPREAPDY